MGWCLWRGRRKVITQRGLRSLARSLPSAKQSAPDRAAVETSLYETAVWTQASDYAVTAVDNAPLKEQEMNNCLPPLITRAETAIGLFLTCQSLFVASVLRRPWKPEWKEDDRFTEARDRYRNMAILVPMIDEVCHKSHDEWGRIMDEKGIIWGRNGRSRSLC